ncbi:MAG: hypothetical protein II970_03710 [Paludibacteraceae bacterium]|nr:hypothetical protein [Paludibacteraceae bacterium]
MPELKLYTVADIREWLEYNHPTEGLSEQIIAPTRAWAIIHNPYIKDEDAIVAAIFEDGKLAAYTASFPDMLDGKRVWWASTLYCYPQFAGRGYGMIVVGSLMEAHEPEQTYDRWGAKETVEIFSHFGYHTIYTKRYHLSCKKINTASFKGKLAYALQTLKKHLHSWPKSSGANYTLQYTSYIDGEAYAFMQNHKGNDLWLRDQNMLNWILRYPFKQGCILNSKTSTECEFSSNAVRYVYNVLKVYVADTLVGVYLLRHKDSECAVMYLYYEEKYSKFVFDSVVDHVIAERVDIFTTDNRDLFSYVQHKLYFPKKTQEDVSFSVPAESVKLNTFSMQFADGDSFA